MRKVIIVSLIFALILTGCGKKSTTAKQDEVNNINTITQTQQETDKEVPKASTETITHQDNSTPVSTNTNSPTTQNQTTNTTAATNKSSTPVNQTNTKSQTSTTTNKSTTSTVAPTKPANTTNTSTSTSKGTTSTQTSTTTNNTSQTSTNENVKWGLPVSQTSDFNIPLQMTLMIEVYNVQQKYNKDATFQPSYGIEWEVNKKIQPFADNQASTLAVPNLTGYHWDKYTITQFNQIMFETDKNDPVSVVKIVEEKYADFLRKDSMVGVISVYYDASKGVNRVVLYKLMYDVN